VKSKLKRFEIISQRENVVEPGKEIFLKIKGNWNRDYFKRDKPITLELACGRGEYSVGMAKLFSGAQFYWCRQKKAIAFGKAAPGRVEDQLSNVAFLRTEILFIESFIADGEMDEIWLTFPDPRPRIRDAKRRLSSSRYIDMYKKLLRPGGYFRFKTDNTDLFNFTLEELGQRNDLEDFEFTHDLYASDLRAECYDIKTRYEEMFAAKGEKIKYLRFRFAT
jgi:tRNA (guanine-N7-)-methyltransferase